MAVAYPDKGLGDLLPIFRAEVHYDSDLREGGSMEAERTAAEVGRKLGVSKHTVYAWNQVRRDECGGGAATALSLIHI